MLLSRPTRRREFISLLGGAATWPLAAHAQQAIPVVGFLSTRAPSDDPHLLAAVRQGLKDAGYIEHQNIAIEYRFAENQNDRLSALAADLVHRQAPNSPRPPPLRPSFQRRRPLPSRFCSWPKLTRSPSNLFQS